MANKPLTPGTQNALDTLRASEGNVTLDQLNAASDEKIASAHLTALVKRGLVVSEDVEVEVVTTKTVKAYTLTEDGTNFEAASPEAE